MSTACVSEPQPLEIVSWARSSSVSVLVVDDDGHLLEATRDWLNHLGFRVATARNLKQARERLVEMPFDLVLSDLRLDQGCGLEILKLAKLLQPECSCLAMTGYANAGLLTRAAEAGASKVLHKPLDDRVLIETFESILREQKLAKRDRDLTRSLDQHLESASPKPSDWFGSGARMQEIFELLERVVDSKASILITGEPGTGKSKLAKYIHQRSNRKSGPFVEVACGAIPEPLLESELFGHAAGAFTGATVSKVGKFQYAQGGTLFLDEIATASMAMQVRLLRVLQSRCFEAVGSNETIRTDARMIFATNEDLEQAVSSGRFRQDLFYRIHVVPIELPPLRHRLEDLRELADGFLSEACREFGRAIEGFSPCAYQTMLEHAWPGNVRELENTIQRAVLLSLGQRIESRDLERLLTKNSVSKWTPDQHALPPLNPGSGCWSEKFKDLEEALSTPEKAILLGALEAYGWNRQLTAQRLGINRTTLYKKMKRLGIDSNRSAQ